MAADDRTGALEVAAALADRGVGGGAGVAVAVWPTVLADDVDVVDLGSRHLSPERAAARAGGLGAAGPVAHKIDSTLRGNWASELVARHRSTHRAVLLVPALPALGRVCADGLVLVHGRPVHEGVGAWDARLVVASSRPAEHLRAAGADAVRELGSSDEVADWMGAPTGFAVVDAVTDEDVAAIVSLWSAVNGVLLAGTSSVIAAVAGASSPDQGTVDRRLPAPVLVVCGSASPAARRQVGVASERGAEVTTDREVARAALRAGRHAVLCSPPLDRRVSPADAESMAATLATDARRLVGELPELGALIVIGGDTAAALLGETTVRVIGSLAPGTAWVASTRFDPPVITRAGGFGGDGDLADLVWGTLRT